MRVRLEIEPDLCGPISVGTGAVVRLLHEHLGLSLSDALGFVDRCVFDGLPVEIPAPSGARVEALIRACGELPPVPRVRASLLT